MDLRKVLYFHSVAKYLNFSKAAEECRIAQTAMSRAIANLESELGFTLFYRDHHVVELTPAGKHFLEQTKEVLRIYSSAQQVGMEIAAGSKDSISIGFGGYEMGFVEKYVTGELCSRYGLKPFDALQRFLNSKTYQMVCDKELAMWEFSDRAIFDIWEAERVTGDPRNSAYIRSEI